jgi:putative Mn2+ efflux pump MntP
MDFITSVIIAIGLAMDAFAVSLGVGTSRSACDKRSIFRLSFHFGLFQGGMTFLGWLAGSTISRWIQAFDHWIALILLTLVGINMIRSGLDAGTKSYLQNPSKGSYLVLLSVATSIDALAVGLSLAFIHTKILLPVLVIALVTAGLSLFGLCAGNGLGERFGKKMEIAGGLLLIGIGIRILVGHLITG